MQSFMKLCFVLFTLVLSGGLANADTPAQPGPAKLAVIVDTSRSMIAPAAQTAQSTSSLIRDGLISSVTSPAYPLEVDLWQFNGRDNSECTPHLVHDASVQSDDSLVKALNQLKHLQAENGILLDQKQNAISGALNLASSRAVGGIVLVTDRLNDCHLSADQVCALAGELSVPLNVVSFADSNRARQELECLAEVSHGTFMHVSDGREAVTLIKAMVALSAARARVSVAEQLNLELSHAVETLVHNNRELIDNNEALIAENMEITKINGDLREENGILRTKINRALLKIDELIAENEQLKIVISEQEDLIAAQKIEIASLKQKILDLQKIISHMEEQVQALHSAVVNLEGEVADLRVQLEACNTRNMSLESQIAGLKVENEELRQTVIIATNNCEARVADERERSELELENLTEYYERLIATINERIAELEEYLRQKEESIKKLHAHIAILEDELKHEREENAKLVIENAKLKEIIVGLEAAVAKLMRDLEHCSAERHDLRHELAAVTEKLQQCQQEKAGLEGDLTQSKASLKTCEGKLGAALTQLGHLETIEGENEKLKVNLAALEAKYHQCVTDKATFLEGLSPLIVDHLEDEAGASKH